MIIIGIALMFLGKPDSFWNVLLNPFRVPDNVHPIIWEGILIKTAFPFIRQFSLDDDRITISTEKGKVCITVD